MTYFPVILFLVTVLTLLGIAGYDFIEREHQYGIEEIKDVAGRPVADRNPRVTMKVVFSAVVLASGVFIILSRQYSPQDKHWAYGSLGTILGYWLKAK